MYKDMAPWVSQRRRLILALDFLEITKQKWAGIIESTVHTSVEELAYMNWICFSIFSKNINFDTDEPKLSCACHDNLLSRGKCKIPRDSADLRARKKMEANQIFNEQSHPNKATKQLMPQPRGCRPPPTQGGVLVYRTIRSSPSCPGL